MYQYKAILRSTKQIVAEGHSIKSILALVKSFKRQQRKGIHTHANDQIEIIHVHRDKLHGFGKPKLVKIV